jgi:hypothetical protein
MTQPLRFTRAQNKIDQVLFDIKAEKMAGNPAPVNI